MAKSAATRYPAAMKSFNVTMPEELLAYVRSRTKEGGFGTPTEFMRHLIRKDQEERLERELEERLVVGLKSGRSRVPAKQFFEYMHKLVDQVSEGKRRKAKGRSGKATRSAARG
jgi:antitoxin ParD1/3/4